MRAISILYHDVISNGDYDASGFPGPGAAPYKLEREEFERHLRAIAEAISHKPITVFDLLEKPGTRFPLLLTFDDGGASAYPCTAELLGNWGWPGHFFVTAGYVGTPTFLAKDQIRALRNSGHVIGSHSRSHPQRMSACSRQQLVEEWETSVRFLSDILGEQVIVASVPGGYYSKKVAEAASTVGIKVLFTSEPTTRAYHVHGCLVLGRYSIWRGMGPEVAAGFASGRLTPRLKQLLFWNAKKMAKSMSGENYLRLRKLLLSRG